MKSFAVSIILFALMTAAITVNSLYIDKVTDTLEQMVISLPADGNCTEQMSAINEYWRRNIDIVSVSVNFHETEALTDTIIAMKAHSSTPDSPEFEYARTKFLELVKEIRLGEKISISNIL